MTRYCIKLLGPRKQLSILPSPSIMLERDTSLAEQPFNGESMVSQSPLLAELTHLWKEFLEHLRHNSGELAAFWMSYIYMVEDILLGLR